MPCLNGAAGQGIHSGSDTSRLEDTPNTNNEPGKTLTFPIVCDDHDVLSRLNASLGPLNMRVRPVEDFHLPEPPVWDPDPSIQAAAQAMIVSESLNMPAIAYARRFVIDPLLEKMHTGRSSRDPLWQWRVPYLGPLELLGAKLRRLDIDLENHGYFGYDERRWAYLQSTLCLSWSDGQTHVFVGRCMGQFEPVFNYDENRDQWVPDLERSVIPLTLYWGRQPNDSPPRRTDDKKQAVRALRRGLCTSLKRRLKLARKV